MARNKVTGKCYIGKTQYQIEHTRDETGAIIKRGRQLRHREFELIEEINTVQPNGYNSIH